MNNETILELLMQTVLEIRTFP